MHGQPCGVRGADMTTSEPGEATPQQTSGPTPRPTPTPAPRPGPPRPVPRP
ncbi:DNA repair ATPase, partial [Mycolicibacterium boenickei]